jgi:adenine-specific DNA-methyltransferase
MNYIGSKLSLLEFIDETIMAVLAETGKMTTELVFADLFAGTGIVGSYFKRKDFKIISNDIQYYSYVLNERLIGNNENLEFKGLFGEVEALEKNDDNLEKVLEYLSKEPYRKGFIYENYCLEGTQGKEFERMYFNDHNAKKCDAIRYKISSWKETGKVDDREYYGLLSSLIYSMDQYANTASVYGAFLKKIKKTAQKELHLRPYGSVYDNKKQNEVYNRNVNELIKEIEGDVLYLDPPYNHRQYDANYHILETIARNDDPEIKGKTGLRKSDDQKSDFCSKRRSLDALEDLVDSANFKYIFLSYNDEGIIPMEEIERVFKERGDYRLFSKEYRRYKASTKSIDKVTTTEYIHCLIKG